MAGVMERLILNTKINFLNIKTKIFFSISNNPSNRGAKFYNKYFKKKNYIYLPLKIKNKIMLKYLVIFLKKNIINFGGASISMPFNEEIIKYVVKKDTSVQVTKNANTIILKKNKLVAFNTDFLAAKKISKKIISNNIIIIGAGALATTFLTILKRKKIFVYNRSRERFAKLNKRFVKIKKINYDKINEIEDFAIINATPCLNKIKLYNYIDFNKARLIIDCAISSKKTFLNKLAEKFFVNYINGTRFYNLQRFFQKKIYLNEKL